MPKASDPRKAQKVGLVTRAVMAFSRPNKKASADFKPLNFKVPEEFRSEFKLYALQNGMSMVDLLKKSFSAFKDRRGR